MKACSETRSLTMLPSLRVRKASEVLTELAITTEFSVSTSGDGSDVSGATKELRSLKRALTISKWPSFPPRSP